MCSVESEVRNTLASGTKADGSPNLINEDITKECHRVSTLTKEEGSTIAQVGTRVTNALGLGMPRKDAKESMDVSCEAI